MRHMLTYTEPLGRLVRAPLRWIPPRAVLRVLSGPNRGLKWEKGASSNGCWLGIYERAFAERLARAIAPGMTDYDVGAHAGYYTLLAARRAAHVYAFEPMAENAAAISSRHDGIVSRRRIDPGTGWTTHEVAHLSQLNHRPIQGIRLKSCGLPLRREGCR